MAVTPSAAKIVMLPGDTPNGSLLPQRISDETPVGSVEVSLLYEIVSVFIIRYFESLTIFLLKFDFLVLTPCILTLSRPYATIVVFRGSRLLCPSAVSLTFFTVK